MSSGSNLGEAAWDAYKAGIRGEFTKADAWFSHLGENETAEGQAWATALRAQRWHAEPEAGELPAEEVLGRFVAHGADVRLAAAIACLEASRASVLQRDLVALRGWKALIDDLDIADEPRIAVGRQIVSAWLSLAEGEPEAGSEAAASAASHASQEQLASYVIEATAIGALCAAEQGDLETATAFARRGSRMARTEDLPQWQYLANLALARVRRLSGTPHLSARIVGALARVVPSSWYRWVAWEALLAGALPVAAALELDDQCDPRGEARTLGELLQAAATGQPERFASAMTMLEQLDIRWSSQRAEVRDALCALDARADFEQASHAVRGWCAGLTAEPPGSIKGLCTDTDEQRDAPSHAAYVLAEPLDGVDGCRGRRIAGLGAPVVRADVTVSKTEGRSERTPATLSVFALSGTDGVSRDELFRAVYGFGYRHVAHRGLLKTLLHRVRRAIGDAGTVLDSDDDRFRLLLTRSLLVPDPRSGRSLEDRVLRLLSRGGGESAKEAAQQLGVSLRTAQLALKALVEDGALSTRRVGRSTEYQVEDTTFSEPTRW